MPGNSVWSCHFDCFYTGHVNFGTFEINWEAKPVTINVNVRDIHGTPVLGETLCLPDLQPGYFKSKTVRGSHVQRHCTLEYDLPWYRKYILAFNFFAAVTGMQLSHLRLRILHRLFPALTYGLLLVWVILKFVLIFVEVFNRSFFLWGAVFVGALVTLLVLGVVRLMRPSKSPTLKED